MEEEEKMLQEIELTSEMEKELSDNKGDEQE